MTKKWIQRNARLRLKQFTCGALFALLAAGTASGQRYEMTVYPLPDTDARWSYFARVEGMNNRGEIVGWVWNLRNDVKAVLWRADGTMVFLPGLPGTGREPTAIAWGINDNGVIVGQADPLRQEFGQQAVMWTDPQTIIPIIDRDSSATDVNNAMVVIGGYAVAFLDVDPFLWENGEWFSLHPPMKFEKDINNRKQVLGRSSDVVVYVWEDGKFTALPALRPGAQAVAASINDHGVVSGWSKKDDDLHRPVLWVDGQVREMPTLLPGYSGSIGRTINNEGVGLGSCNVGFNDFRQTIWRNNLVTQINDLLLVDPKESVWVISSSHDLNDKGQIAVHVQIPGQLGVNVARLDPVDVGLTLWGIEPSRPGVRNTIEIHHVAPGGRVTLIWGTQRGEPTPLPQCDDAMIDVKDPRIAGTATADSDGIAYINVNVPQNVNGLFILQAIDNTTCEVSPPSMALLQNE